MAAEIDTWVERGWVRDALVGLAQEAPKNASFQSPVSRRSEERGRRRFRLRGEGKATARLGVEAPDLASSPSRTASIPRTSLARPKPQSEESLRSTRRRPGARKSPPPGRSHLPGSSHPPRTVPPTPAPPLRPSRPPRPPSSGAWAQLRSLPAAGAERQSCREWGSSSIGCRVSSSVAFRRRWRRTKRSIGEGSS